MKRSNIKLAVAVVLALSSSKAAYAQDITQIAKSDPLIITGAVGTKNTYYHSTVGEGYASPWNNMFNVNTRTIHCKSC